MRRRVLFACLLAVVILVGDVADLFAATDCESSLPSNIDAGSLQPIALALLQRSPTFQQQCHRIAATIVLRVRVRVTPVLVVGARGATIIRRYESGALRAEVMLFFGGDYEELLAHEFEHVLEQVERVRLADQAADNRAWLTASGAFETARALAVGLRARQESERAAVYAMSTHGSGVKGSPRCTTSRPGRHQRLPPRDVDGHRSGRVLP